jgi:uncharacterized protein
MTPTEGLGLSAVGMAAGAINAVAGGGTLLTFPTLLFFNTPPVVANATSTLALVVGTTGSVFGYRPHLAAIKPWLWRFVPVSILGGLLGGMLLTRTSDETFSRLVPFLILFATLVFMAQGTVRRLILRAEEHSPPSQLHLLATVVFQLAVAIYGGYFGAGIGILMLAALGLMGLTHIHEMNALKTVLGSLINVVAAVWFIVSGLIDWPKAAVMTIGALAGYFLGSHYSQRIPQTVVRQLITFIGFVLAAVIFYKEFIR